MSCHPFGRTRIFHGMGNWTDSTQPLPPCFCCHPYIPLPTIRTLVEVQTGRGRLHDQRCFFLVFFFFFHPLRNPWESKPGVVPRLYTCSGMSHIGKVHTPSFSPRSHFGPVRFSDWTAASEAQAIGPRITPHLLYIR